jgi:hypothetical protein
MKKYLYCMQGIVYKELIRFLKQKSRFFFSPCTTIALVIYIFSWI